MRKAIAALLFFAATSAVADSNVEVRRGSHELMSRMREARKAIRAAKARHRVGPNVVGYEANEHEFVIPSAGSLAAAGGTFFRSELTFINFEPDEQDVVVTWLQRGVDGSNAPQWLLTLPAESWITYRDFVGASLQKSGLGALVVSAVDADGNPDRDAYIDAFSRIWTPQPGSSGSVSLSFEAVVPSHSYGAATTPRRSASGRMRRSAPTPVS